MTASARRREERKEKKIRSVYRLLDIKVCLPARNGLVLLSAWIQVFYRILLNRKINVALLTNILTNQEDRQTVRTPPPLQKKKERKKRKEEQPRHKLSIYLSIYL